MNRSWRLGVLGNETGSHTNSRTVLGHRVKRGRQRREKVYSGNPSPLILRTDQESIFGFHLLGEKAASR